MGDWARTFLSAEIVPFCCPWLLFTWKIHLRYHLCCLWGILLTRSLVNFAAVFSVLVSQHCSPFMFFISLRWESPRDRSFCSSVSGSSNINKWMFWIESYHLDHTEQMMQSGMFYIFDHLWQSERERTSDIWQARVLNWPWVVQDVLIARPRGISRFRSWAEQKRVDRLLFSYHNEKRTEERPHLPSRQRAGRIQVTSRSLYSVLFWVGRGISSPEIRAGSALAAGAGPSQRPTVTPPLQLLHWRHPTRVSWRHPPRVLLGRRRRGHTCATGRTRR